MSERRKSPKELDELVPHPPMKCSPSPRPSQSKQDSYSDDADFHVQIGGDGEELLVTLGAVGIDNTTEDTGDKR
jgi:hypothetical protein